MTGPCSNRTAGSWYRSRLVSVGEAAAGSTSAPLERSSSAVTCAHAGSAVTANRRPVASGAVRQRTLQHGEAFTREAFTVNSG